MKKLTVLTSLFLGLTTSLFAQNARFATEGVIEFERNINMYAIIGKQVTTDNPWMTQIFESYKKNNPQFKVVKSNLYFTKDKTMFKPVEDDSPPIQYFGDSPDFTQVNIVMSDLAAQSKLTQKKVYEETFLVKDSTRTINWKITGETREIAGYQCRRANAVIMDSVYVVAFYTDEIPVSGGPESFNGLPGMILGVALPHENTTWFAKIVNDRAVDPKDMVPPKKGKPTDAKGLTTILNDALKDYGNYAKKMFKAFLM